MQLQVVKCEECEMWDSCTFKVPISKSGGDGYVNMEFGIEGNLFRYIRDLRPLHGHIWRIEIFYTEFATSSISMNWDHHQTLYLWYFVPLTMSRLGLDPATIIFL